MNELAATQLGALSYGQSIAVLVGAMVVVAVATAALEAHTPTARRRTTKFTLPRRVEGEVDTLPTMESVRTDYDRHLADALTPKPSVLLRPGPQGPQPVAPAGVGGFEAIAAAALYEQRLEVGPPTEEVPIVIGPAWATTESFDPAARAAIRHAVAARMAAPLDWNGTELRVRVPGFVTGPNERYLEDEIAAALEQVESLKATEVAAKADAASVLPAVAKEEPEPLAAEHVVAESEEPAPEAPERELVGVGPADRPKGSGTVFALRPELPDAGMVELGEIGRDRELAGVLFAAYVASGGEERNRVTGWIAPRAAAPSLPGIEPTGRLRGRPGKVAKLLACTDDTLNWVTLDERTDIRRGLTAKAPTDPVLKGIVWWWFMATDDAARVPAEHVSVLREGLEQVAPVLEDHPYAAIVGQLITACGEAEAARVGLRLESVTVPSKSRPDRRKRRAPAPEADEAVAIAV